MALHYRAETTFYTWGNADGLAQDSSQPGIGQV